MTSNDLIGTINTGMGMKIIMKSDTTKRQMELAKEIYPNAIITKEHDLLHSLYENENGNQECAIWLNGEESNAIYFEVVNGILKIK